MILGKKQDDVIIAGAGPVGLLAGLTLARNGIKVSILEKEKRTKLHSYALALHPATIEILDAVGVAGPLLETGHRINKVGFFSSGRKKLEIDFNQLDAPYAFILIVPQSELEHVLLTHLVKLGVKPVWNSELLDFQQTQHDVIVEMGHIAEITQGYPIMRVQRMRSSTSRLTTRFLIGADGYNSLVRKIIHSPYNIIQPGETYAIFEFISTAPDADEVCIVEWGGKFSVLWPMGRHRFRWSFMTDDNPLNQDADEALSALINERAPWMKHDNVQITWTTTVHFDKRLVSSFGLNRVWLAGDAAHVTSPIGVHSMNIGLSEAYDLACRLTSILKNQSGDDLLQHYNDHWLGVWGKLMDCDVRLSWEHERDQWLSTHAPKIPECVPASGDHLIRLLDSAGIGLK